MNVCLLTNVFLRHVGNKSMVCCLRTEGCTVFVDAQLILEEITWEWRSITEIINKVAARFCCTVDEFQE